MFIPIYDGDWLLNAYKPSNIQTKITKLGFNPNLWFKVCTYDKLTDKQPKICNNQKGMVLS